MFEKARYIHNSFSISFPRRLDIRRKANEFEDALAKIGGGHYRQPHVIPVPDELDPEVPRLIFGSTHGFSQIVATQVSLSLNVTYSLDWQVDISKGKAYLLGRRSILFKLLDLLDSAIPCFCGLLTQVRMASEASDEAILLRLANLFVRQVDLTRAHDIEVKVVSVVEDRFYSHLTVRNYREWELPQPASGLPRFPQKRARERGVQLMGDFNDRYTFNEQSDYVSGADVAGEIIESGLTEMEQLIALVRG